MNTSKIDSLFDALPVIAGFAVSLCILIGMTRLYG